MGNESGRYRRFRNRRTQRRIDAEFDRLTADLDWQVDMHVAGPRDYSLAEPDHDPAARPTPPRLSGRALALVVAALAVVVVPLGFQITNLEVPRWVGAAWFIALVALVGALVCAAPRRRDEDDDGAQS